jgi:hypothetical protein
MKVFGLTLELRRKVISKRILSETILHVDLSSQKKTALLTSNGGIYRTPYAYIENANGKKKPTKPTKLCHQMMILRLSLRPLLQEYVPINIGGKAAVRRRLWRYNRAHAVQALNNS